jgi:hypothetical protein
MDAPAGAANAGRGNAKHYHAMEILHLLIYHARKGIST